jgi:hypothetical protein
MLEPQKIGCQSTALAPLFFVGDIIMSDVGRHGLQQAFVLKSDHPQYQLRLESGVTVGTSMAEAILTPRLSDLVPDQDNPFAKVKRQVKQGESRMGSYGVPGNAQWELLQLVEEAKVFAKAVC